ncbi:MAG: metal ABC transporter ATP-binding protein [Candidatus Moranbacteria bacterium]|nr:metal ABC transporter ATP-binding protein [Candidatus Moranbacteria bacterium]
MQRVDHTKNVISVEAISFSYDGERDVLEDITLDVHQGDYIGLVGPNGAGKTTLLKVMINLLVPRSGTVKLFGQDIRDFKDWQKIGYVPQKAVRFDANFPATVSEVVLMGRTSGKGFFQRTTDADTEAVGNALEKVGMLGYGERLIGDLSGGQQQRVFIARALVNDPEVVFLDEPTTGVDKKTQDGFYALLQKLNREFGLTIVLVSHDIRRLTREVMHIACVDRTLTCHSSPEEYLSESEAVCVNGKDVKLITHHHRE